MEDNNSTTLDNSNNNSDNSCLICYIQVDKIIILCKDCKYIYCESCAKNISYCCAICNRKKEVILNNYHNPNRMPLYLTFTFSIFFFLLMVLLYIVVFTAFSYYFFVRYDPVYKFIIYAKQNNLASKVIYLNDSVNKIVPNILDDTVDYLDIYNMCFPNK